MEVYRGSWCPCSGICTCSKIDNIQVLYTRIAGNGNANARYSGFYWLSTPNTSTPNTSMPNTSMPNSDTGACYYLNFLRAC